MVFEKRNRDPPEYQPLWRANGILPTPVIGLSAVSEESRWSVADDDNQVAGLDEASQAESPMAERGGGDAWFSDKDPGWYNLGTNPNEQSYWDGQRWSGVRHWVAGRGWMEGGAVTGGRSSGGQAAPRLNANPYAQAVTAAYPPGTRSRTHDVERRRPHDSRGGHRARCMAPWAPGSRSTGQWAPSISAPL